MLFAWPRVPERFFRTALFAPLERQGQGSPPSLGKRRSQFATPDSSIGRCPPLAGFCISSKPYPANTREQRPSDETAVLSYVTAWPSYETAQNAGILFSPSRSPVGFFPSRPAHQAFFCAWEIPNCFTGYEVTTMPSARARILIASGISPKHAKCDWQSISRNIVCHYALGRD